MVSATAHLCTWKRKLHNHENLNLGSASTNLIRPEDGIGRDGGFGKHSRTMNPAVGNEQFRRSTHTGIALVHTTKMSLKTLAHSNMFVAYENF